MKLLFYFVMLFAVGCSATAAEAPAQKQKEVHGQGCIETGVEARCLVLKDIKSARIYNLIFRGLQPAHGEGIEFVAAPHSGPTPCMQGTPLDVIAWQRKDQLNCRPVAPRRK
jgi:hypothetical protein